MLPASDILWPPIAPPHDIEHQRNAQDSDGTAYRNGHREHEGQQITGKPHYGTGHKRKRKDCAHGRRAGKRPRHMRRHDTYETDGTAEPSRPPSSRSSSALTLPLSSGHRHRPPGHNHPRKAAHPFPCCLPAPGPFRRLGTRTLSISPASCCR